MAKPGMVRHGTPATMTTTPYAQSGYEILWDLGNSSWGESDRRLNRHKGSQRGLFQGARCPFLPRRSPPGLVGAGRESPGPRPTRPLPGAQLPPTRRPRTLT